MERKTRAESDPQGQEPWLPIMYPTLCPMSNTTEASRGELFGCELCHEGRAAQVQSRCSSLLHCDSSTSPVVGV